MRGTRARLMVAVLLAALLLSGAGCARREAKPVSGQPEDYHVITVASASSMKPALELIAKRFKNKTGDQAQLVLGSSGLLARQIENGAPFDIYISANREYMDGLVEKGLVIKSRPYASGVIVLIGKTATLGGLKEPVIRNIAIANPGSSPYGAAAQEALINAEIFKDIEGKLVISENVAQVYDFVKTGNTDAGIVALSLVKGTKMDYSRIDQKLYKPIEQWVGMVERSETTPTAQAFIDYLRSEPVRVLLKKHGFGQPEAK